MIDIRLQIHTRRLEIETKILELQGQLCDLAAAESRLDAAEAEALAMISNSFDVQTITEAPVRAAENGEAPRTPTIKEMVLEVLGVADGIDALTILDYIKQRFGVDIPRTSLSPQLSRLKSEGKVTLHRKRWSLAHKEETPAEAGVSSVGGVAERSNASASKADEPVPSTDIPGSEGSNPSTSAQDSSDFAEPDEASATLIRGALLV